jgi:hypothetical protein
MGPGNAFFESLRIELPDQILVSGPFQGMKALYRQVRGFGLEQGLSGIPPLAGLPVRLGQVEIPRRSGFEGGGCFGRKDW